MRVYWVAILSLLWITPVWAGGRVPQEPPPAVQQQMRERLRLQREQQQIIQRRQQEIQRQIQQRALQQRAPAQPQQPPQPQKKPQPTYPKSQVLTSSPPTQPSPVRRQQAAPQISTSSSASPDLAQLINQFDQSSEVWVQIQDARVKALVLSRYIDLYRQYGILIRKPPLHYVNLINSMARDNAAMLAQPLDQVLRVVAIIEYDYDNGQDKDSLARSVLDQRAFIQNKQRLANQ